MRYSAREKEKNTSDRCRFSRECGGCQYINLPYKEGIRKKFRRVQETLGEFADPEYFITQKHPEHYRCKVHAVFTGTSRHVITGLYAEGTHRIVPVEHCLLEDERADAIIQTVRKLAGSFKIKIYDEDTGYGLLRHILIRTGRKTGEILVVLVMSSPVFPSKNDFIRELTDRHPEITSIVININDRRTNMILGGRQKTVYGTGYITDEICGMKFRISPASFYQVNPEQAEKLYMLAMEMAQLTGSETVVECYSGVGTIGILMARKAKEVISVELNADAVRDARINARMNGVENIIFYENDAGKLLEQMEEAGDRPDVLIMDPPRTGASAGFIASCMRLAPKCIVYISCEPDTLARDLKLLCAPSSGHPYRVRRLVPVDMFPFTRAVEVVCVLDRDH